MEIGDCMQAVETGREFPSVGTAVVYGYVVPIF